MSAKDFNYIMNKVAEFSDRKFGSKRPFEDLVKACDFKLYICENREWSKPDENGVIEHVREENESTNNGWRYGLVKADHYRPIKEQNFKQLLLTIPLVVF